MGDTLPEFVAFPKISRLNRTVIVTEKIDGTNGIIHIAEDGVVAAGSRSRWITPEKDNFGFAAWVKANEEDLRKLGPGYHYGEWWGLGIQRGYGLKEKRFSLFNSSRWTHSDVRPACCGVVPILCADSRPNVAVEAALAILRSEGSRAAPGFTDPEGIVAFLTASRTMFKVTLKNDDEPKTKGGAK